VGSTGEAIKINLSFSAASTASKIVIAIWASADATEQTLICYDLVNQQVFIDCTKSGVASFDKTFASVYHRPLTPGVNLTAQIFPSSDAIYAQLVSTGGATKNLKLDIYNVTSTWN
jgi:fructan beta-fructosidase